LLVGFVLLNLDFFPLLLLLLLFVLMLSGYDCGGNCDLDGGLFDLVIGDTELKKTDSLHVELCSDASSNKMEKKDKARY